MSVYKLRRAFPSPRAFMQGIGAAHPRATHSLLASGITMLAILTSVCVFTILGHSPRDDFLTYYSAGQAVRAGTDLYGLALAWRDAAFTVNLPAPLPENNTASPYVYPPIFALVVSPLTFLSPTAASALWYVGSFVCVALSVWLLAGLLVPSTNRWKTPLVLGLMPVAMLFGPVRTNFAAGQTDCMLLLLLVLTFVAHARQRSVPAGLWLACAVAIKPTIGFLALYFLWKRSYRAVIAFGAAALILLAVPSLVLFGPRSLTEFLSVGQYWSSADFAVSPINQSPYGLLLRLFTVNPFTTPLAVAPGAVAIAKYLIPVVVIVVLSRYISRSAVAFAQDSAMEYGVFIVGLLIASPVSEDNHYTYLVFPMIAAVASLILRPRLPKHVQVSVILGLLLSFVALSWPALRSIRNVNFTYYEAPISGSQILLTGAFLYGLLLFAAVMVYLTVYSRSRSAEISRAC